MQDVNRQVVLARRPKGYPIESDFDLIETPIPKPNQEEILVRTIYLSVDPYMRGRMNAGRKSYAPPVEDREVSPRLSRSDGVRSRDDAAQRWEHCCARQLSSSIGSSTA